LDRYRDLRSHIGNVAKDLSSNNLAWTTENVVAADRDAGASELCKYFTLTLFLFLKCFSSSYRICLTFIETPLSLV
jgi:hypothetical protein